MLLGRLVGRGEGREQVEGNAKKLSRRAATLRLRGSGQRRLGKLEERISDLNRRIDAYKTAEKYLEIVGIEFAEEAEAFHAQGAIAVSEHLFAQAEAMGSALDALNRVDRGGRGLAGREGRPSVG